MTKQKIENVSKRITSNYVVIYLCVFWFVFSLSHKTYAQQSPKEIDPETLNLIRETAIGKGQETGAVIILKDYQFIINKKNLATTVIRILGKIYSKQAISDYSQIPIAYNSFYEEAVLNFARVIHNDGSIREVPSDAVQIKTYPDVRGGTQYTDNQYLSFALSGLEAGAAFEYKITFNQKNPIIEGEWFDNHWFAGMLQSLSPPYTPRIDPVLTSRYTVRVPKGREFQHYLTLGSLEPIKKTVKDQDEYLWVFNNLPAITVEAAMPDLGSLNPIVIISSLKDWSQLNQWVYNKLIPKIEVTQEIKDLSVKLTSIAKTDNEKIKSIADYIQNNIQYIYADLDRGGYTPHMAGEVLRSRYGDCKDQTILLISMLKAVGIEAYPALITPYPNEEYVQIPTIYFSHLITYIPQSAKDIWLDMTSGVTPFPNLVYPNQNRTAFVINETGGMLKKTPVSPAEENTSNFDLATSFDKETGKVHILISASGAPSDVLKLTFKQADKDAQEQYLRSIIKSFVENAIIDSINISDVHAPELNFWTSIKYHIDSIWKKDQPAFNFGSHAMIPLTFLANADERSFPAKRCNDIRGPYIYSINGSERYISPVKDLMPLAIPNDDSLKNDFFYFKRIFTGEGDIVNVKWTFAINQLTIPKEQYEAYINSHKTLKELALWNVTYVEPTAFARDAFNNDTPQAILAYSINTLKQDSTNILFLLLKGLSYNELQKKDSSVIAFSKVLKTEPGNKFAHLWIAAPLFSLNKSDEALAHIDEALRLDPNYKEAYYIRGSYYENIGLYEKALVDFENYIKVDKGNEIVWQNKGFIMRKLGKNKEAVNSFQMAVKINPNNPWTYASLGDTYIELKQYKDAEASYLNLIKLNPSESSNYGNLGWVYYLLNDDLKCIEYSLKAIKLDSHAYYARFNLALANLRLGYYEQAKELYSQLAKEKAVTFNVRMGAIDDLNALRSKGIRVNEVTAILKQCFGM